LRGIIVHQHGAGTTASIEGSTAAYDLHWQALAKNWDCALFSFSYHVLNERTDLSPGGFEVWFDPPHGSANMFRSRSEFPGSGVPAAVDGIPSVCNPGVKEKPNIPWTRLLSTFQEYRAKGAPIGFAPDPRTGHECGDCRYLAIPFFDACLAMRLPEGVFVSSGPVQASPTLLMGPRQSS
jgi:hypothetical protein